MCRYESIAVDAAFLLILWIINALSQRWNPYAPRTAIPWLLAVLAGSKNEMVMWRAFTIQVGIVVYMICFTTQLLIWCVQSLIPPAVVAGLAVAILQSQKKS
jgi:hypothetical protein